MASFIPPMDSISSFSSIALGFGALMDREAVDLAALLLLIGDSFEFCESREERLSCLDP